MFQQTAQPPIRFNPWTGERLQNETFRSSAEAATRSKQVGYDMHMHTVHMIFEHYMAIYHTEWMWPVVSHIDNQVEES